MKSLKETETETHETGAVRSTDANNERYDLITPIGLRRLAVTYKEGSDKYSDFNWEKGFKESCLLNHALRHINLWLSGDRTEDHLSHSVWNLMTLIHFTETRPDLLDIQNRHENKTTNSAATI